MTEVNRLAKIAELWDKDNRRKQAAALRALRRCDKAMARFVLKKWKDDDIISRAASDVLLYGYSKMRIEHVPIQEAVAPDSDDRTNAGTDETGA